jgi:transposase
MLLTVPRHTSAAFVEFLGEIVASQPKGREIHVILDNLATHKAQAVRTFLIAHPNVRLHFTPTYGSWLNQVELWFSKIERDLLARGIFTSVADLARKIRGYIRDYNKAAKPIRWSYRNPAHPRASRARERDGRSGVRGGHRSRRDPPSQRQRSRSV